MDIHVKHNIIHIMYLILLCKMLLNVYYLLELWTVHYICLTRRLVVTYSLIHCVAYPCHGTQFYNKYYIDQWLTQIQIIAIYRRIGKMCWNKISTESKWNLRLTFYGKRFKFLVIFLHANIKIFDGQHIVVRLKGQFQECFTIKNSKISSSPSGSLTLWNCK